MPKVHGTRLEKALELLRTAEQGPSMFNSSDPTQTITKAEFDRRYRLWSQSWLVKPLHVLVPELRKRREEAEKGRVEHGNSEG